MTALGIHIATSLGSLGLVSENEVLYTFSTPTTHALTEQLMAHIQTACQTAGCDLKALNCIGVTHGPGSYTGIRVSIALAKTLGQILEKPVYGISTLEAFLWPYRHIEGLYIALMPTRSTEWAAAVFASRDQTLQRMSPDFIWQEAQILEKLQAFQDTVTMVGILPQIFIEKIQNPYLRFIPANVHAEHVATMAQVMLKQSLSGHWKTLIPHYAHLPVVGQKKREL